MGLSDRPISYWMAIDGMSTEEKLVESFSRPSLSAQEITEETERALGEFPPGALSEDCVDVAFDIVYEAIERAIRRVR